MSYQSVAGGARHPAAHAHPPSHSVFGFWLYLMTDCVIFASLFATFAVLGNQFAGGPTAKDLFDIPGVALETAALLLSSITYGFAMLGAQRRRRGTVFLWLAVTFVLGAAFLALELREFSHLIAQGAGPQRSAFLSAFFALVGTHGLHVAVGLLWMVVLVVQIAHGPGMTERDFRRLTCLSLFWHFLDIVWICVFSFVYLASVI
ncbi:cytochrome o ubiquinol oxidase subunit III [Burkholderia sp. Bp9143]|uniref:cytochrome o ubiquinol oxidase subunit III n=1 Tax=Burkholderia sp. Bp9143 TaxID=2184574 RepID=UPI000F5B5622|nr:cytochrome o ubiquinol oxidase subunit III [Burkholderia sp. Bp9143]RQR33801.1 cytochrome o ubiquinol oxidase subunit III [Burkholderia sp. Bp9143]